MNYFWKFTGGKKSGLTGISLIFALSVVLSLFSGCGQKLPDGMPKLFPCTIQITQEGQPLDEAMVLLMPEGEATNLWTIGGRTDSSGTASLRTHGEYQGAPAGNYVVVVTKDEVVTGEPGPRAGRGDMIALPSTTFYHVDPIYRDPAKTTLKVTLEEKKNSLTFDVGKAIRTQAPKRDPKKI